MDVNGEIGFGRRLIALRAREAPKCAGVYFLIGADEEMLYAGQENQPMTVDSPQGTTYRFALVISGAVSLGAYEAGALAQMYGDFHAFNSENSNVKLVIDAIAGSSAGAITGLILAQALGRNEHPIEFRKRLCRCWVDGMDARALLKPPEDRANALFTDESIDKLARSVLSVDDAALPVRTGPFDPEQVIALWITLTNLDGIPYSIDFGPDQPLYAVSHRDYAPFFVDGSEIYYVSDPIENIEHFNPKKCKRVEWDLAKECALASGAFPLAFRSRRLARDLTLYPKYQEFNRLSGLNAPEQASFEFVDGGILDNQPIGRAIDAVSYLNALNRRMGVANRSYVLIEPDPQTAKLVCGALCCLAETEAVDDGAPPSSVMPRLIAAYFYDSLYRDFEKAAEVNRRLQQFNEVASRLSLTVTQKQEILKSLGMERKHRVNLERIPVAVPLKDRLAGDFAGHFGGLFERKLREHDFAQGEFEASQWFARWLERNSLVYEARFPPPQPPADLADTSWADLCPDQRSEILNSGINRIGNVLLRRIPSLRELVPALSVAVTAYVDSLLVRRNEICLDWYAEIVKLHEKPLGKQISAFAASLVAICALAGLIAGSVATRYGILAALVAGGLVGMIPFLLIAFWVVIFGRCPTDAKSPNDRIQGTLEKS